MPTHPTPSTTPRRLRRPLAGPPGKVRAPDASGTTMGHRAARGRARFSLADVPRGSSIWTWALLPLRLFLGVTFVYAGLQKLTDPQYFKASAAGYIGKQIAGFAHGSPIGGILLHLAVPHAMLFGTLVAFGEIAIGLGTLVGLLFRPAACFGALLSLIFFLSASWRVYPYFYGADIVFVFGWVTLVLAGPMTGGWPVFDALLARWTLRHVPARHQDAAARVLAVLLGTGSVTLTASNTEVVDAAADAQARGQTGGTRSVRTGRPTYTARGRGRSQLPTTRRDFLRGGLAGAASMLGLVFLVSWFRAGSDTTSTPPGASGGSGAAPTTPASGAATAAASGSGGSIAQVSAVPTNSAAQFTIPSNGDPGILVHLNSGQFVAFDATCTHAGCPVQYDPGSQLLICPCHGAEFDPAHQAGVVQGPTDTPLTSVPIHVDSASGAITLG